MTSRLHCAQLAFYFIDTVVYTLRVMQRLLFEIKVFLRSVQVLHAVSAPRAALEDSAQTAMHALIHAGNACLKVGRANGLFVTARSHTPSRRNATHCQAGGKLVSSDRINQQLLRRPATSFRPARMQSMLHPCNLATAAAAAGRNLPLHILHSPLRRVCMRSACTFYLAWHLQSHG